MRGARLLLLGAIAGLAVIAPASSGAAVEVGRCVGEQPTGKYKSAGCTEAASPREKRNTNKYEWERNPIKGRFTGSGGEVSLVGAAGGEIRCNNSAETGEYSSATRTVGVKNVVLSFHGCQLPLFDGDCQTNGAAAGELISTHLKGKLAYISGKGTKAPVVGQLLAPEVRGPFRTWECAFAGVEVDEGEGPEKGHATLIGLLSPINTMTLSTTERWSGAKGVQEPDHVEGSTRIDNLERSLSGPHGTFERADQEGQMTLEDEEQLEIKAG